MIESWADVLIGMMLGSGATIIIVILFDALRMHFRFVVRRKVREHEREFHAKEIKERENPE